MTRALLTDGERAAFTDESMDDNTAGSQRSRVRSKVRDRLPEDIRILREHDPELLEEIQGIVCERELEERISGLENRVDELESG